MDGADRMSAEVVGGSGGIFFWGGRRGKTICRPKTRKAGAKEFTYRSSTIGRELNISLGVNFCFGLGKH